jgi:hypothetical protein
MQDWSLPLSLSTVAFLALLVWRVRPAVGWGKRRRVSHVEMREARSRIAGAPDPSARAFALCDAADIMAKSIGGAPSARGLYLRAIRSDPRSSEIVRRAAAGLSSRPRTLESLLWRHLAIAPWAGEGRSAARASLDVLRALYEGPLRNPTRARALANARDALAE